MRFCNFCDGDSNGSTFSNGDGSTSGGSNDGTDQTDDDIDLNDGHGLASVPAINQQDIQDPNPTKLKTLTQHPQVKAKITELKLKTSENREYGYQFNISGNNPITYNPIEGELASDNQGIKFPPASVFTQLEMHTHYDGLDNAFSASDLYNMTELSADSNNPEATAILVAPNGKLFALKVTNQTKANAFKTLNEQEGEVKMEEYYYRYVIRWAQIKCNGCTVTELENLITNYLVYYLTLIWDSGLTLYEATEDSDGNITWNEATYTP